MASICEEAPNPPDAQTVAMDAKLMVATDRGDVNKLKNLLNKEDAMAMVVVTATSKKPSEKDDQTPAGLINPLLLASAHHGSWKALHFLLEREDAGRPPMATPTQEFLALLREGKGAIEAPLPATGDVEDQGVEDHPQHDEALPASGTLLKGVTPDGNTALHAVAMNGNGEDFLKYADTADIICGRDMELLFAKNHRGETPLHCAARAGAHKMVSHLIALAGREGADRKLELLRMANKCHETALHEAVRVEDGAMLQDRDRASVEAVLTDKHGKGAEEKSMVKLLMDAYPGLANYPVNGISPLYLAISLMKDTIAVTLYKMSGGNLSYSGQEGQNALHAAVLLATDGVTVMIEELLKWNKGLATQVDKHGSTPLHFASSRSDFFIRRRLWIRIPIYWSLNIVAKVFEANPTALYQADNSGLFPIHVAASVGATRTIEFFLQESPNCAGLRNAKGRTFLHVAVEKRRQEIVSDFCKAPSMQWILNMQDKDGNTALHLAMERKMVNTCCDLLANEKVHLNLSNVKGQTPLDLSRINLPRGMHYTMNSESKMHQALELFGAKHNCLRCDHIEEKYERPLDQEEEKKQSDMIKDATKMFIVGAVLIATVAFGATFAIPGGYKADEHLNGGTPTLAGRFIFDAFMMANTLAFVCSTVGIISLVLSGTSMVDMSTRRMNLAASFFLLSSSVISMTVAFALAAYLVLAPVARSTAIAIFVISPLPMLYRHLMDGIHIWLLVIRAQYGRKRPIGIVLMKFASLVFWFMVWELWPVVVTFAWAGFARREREHH